MLSQAAQVFVAAFACDVFLALINSLYTDVFFYNCEPKETGLVELTFLVFTCMPGESYRKRPRSLLLCLCDILRLLINSLVC